MSLGVDLIRERARTLPDEPGVYVFRGEDGEVLYVGKAKGLKRRVGSYARPDRGLERRTAELVLRVAEIDVTLTASETEALLLEQNLIRQHRPPFNVRLRDDKSYPMIVVTEGEAFPRVMFTRRGSRAKGRLFGPYPSARKVRETLDVLNRVFPYRPCEGPTPGRRSGSPCLDLHIGRCLAPCVGRVSEQDYGRMIDDVVRFLEGDTRTIARQLEGEMRAAASEQRYEDAARARNRLAAVRMLDEQQLVDRADAGDGDVLGVALGDDVAVVHIWPQRGGRLAERVEFVFDNTGAAEADDVVEAALDERYGGGAAVPPLVVVPSGLARRDELAALLADRRGSGVELRTPARGEWRRLRELAQRNAELALEGVRLQDERARSRGADALEELRDRLGLESLPRRIECYDVSTLGGDSQYASMAVMLDGVPRTDQYRTFAIRHGRLDDFASIGEAIDRRFTRLAARDDDASFSTAPDLVVIDGGRGQLNAAIAAMRRAEAPYTAVIGLAKREEEVWLPGRAQPVVLDRDAPGLLLLRQIRDEAHRFAVRQSRRDRTNQATRSALEDLPGVGPARRRALLDHFGTVDALMAASPEAIEAVPGLPAKTAHAIHAALHRIGGPAPSGARGSRRSLPGAAR